MAAKTSEEWLKEFHAGEICWTVEMGGLGPGYELALQHAAIKIMEAFSDVGISYDDEEWWQETGKPLRDGAVPNIGLSAAQVGAATNLAFMFLRQGPEEAMCSVEPGRKIMISKRDFRMGSFDG